MTAKLWQFRAFLDVMEASIMTLLTVLKFSAIAEVRF
jgi:hypothetical protein